MTRYAGSVGTEQGHIWIQLKARSLIGVCLHRDIKIPLPSPSLLFFFFFNHSGRNIQSRITSTDKNGISCSCRGSHSFTVASLGKEIVFYRKHVIDL